jgi:hypothetical protein
MPDIEIDLIVDVPCDGGDGINHAAHACIQAWNRAGLKWQVYNSSSAGDVAFCFETRADADRAKAIYKEVSAC